jgi:predicted lipid carrier protein YhbT
MTTLTQALQDFIHRYHGLKPLVAEQSDWCCAIRLESRDSPERACIEIESGRVVGFAQALEGRSLTVRSDHAVLVDILTLRRDPNEAYLFGELTVEGAEEDFMRLDYIVTCMCAP